MARLIFQTRRRDGGEHPALELGRDEITLGRERGNAVMLDDEKASRFHARIAPSPEGYRLVDNGSANGVWVAGRRVTQHLLKDGDVFAIGDTAIRFEEPARGRRRAVIWIAAGLAAALVVGGAVTAALLATRGIGYDEIAAATSPRRIIPVERGEQLASAEIGASTGGAVATADGLTVRFPAGSLDRDRDVRIYRARVAAPPFRIGFIGSGAEPVAPTVLRAWDVDPGAGARFFPGDVTVAIDAPELAGPAGAALAPLPLVTLDGSTWAQVPFTVEDGKVVFTTRHFCAVILGAVSLTGMATALPVALAVVALAYVIYACDDEMPGWCKPDAPFVHVDTGRNDFDLEWSWKLGNPAYCGPAGRGPNCGMKDVAGYAKKLDAINAFYGRNGGFAQVQVRQEIQAARREFLVPDAVKRVEEALDFGRGYLQTRGFTLPSAAVTTYVVTKESLGDEGNAYDPWLGRPYLVLAGNGDAPHLNTTALHEFFHACQAALVWYSRMGNLPFTEASALLLEREAMPYYAAAGRPFATDGLVLPQFVVYRNGLDGPSSGEKPMQRHGYGLSWFLEYLRDAKYGGDKGAFHAELLKSWGGKWAGKQRKALAWAAGGSDYFLGSALKEFTRDEVAKGPAEDGCQGCRSPFGARYGGVCRPMTDSPFQGSADFGLGPSILDFAAAPYYALGDDALKAWSIQFFRLAPPPRPLAALVARFPKGWFGGKGAGRGVYWKRSVGDAGAVEIDGAWPQAKSSGEVFVSAAFTGPQALYVTDTGQTGSGWISGNDAARLYLLEPPSDVRSEPKDGNLKVTWKAPPLAASHPELLSDYAIYLAGSAAPNLRVPVKSGTEVTIALPPELAGGGDVKVEMTTLDADDPPIESARSAAGAAAAGDAPISGEWKGVLAEQGGKGRAVLHRYVHLLQVAQQKYYLVYMYFYPDDDDDIEAGIIKPGVEYGVIRVYERMPDGAFVYVRAGFFGAGKVIETWRPNGASVAVTSEQTGGSAGDLFSVKASQRQGTAARVPHDPSKPPVSANGVRGVADANARLGADAPKLLRSHEALEAQK